MDGRNSSMAQLSTWTETMKKNATSKAESKGSSEPQRPQKAATEDDYEEEFEDYEDEDFEAEEPVPVAAPAKKSISPVPVAQSKSKPYEEDPPKVQHKSVVDTRFSPVNLPTGREAKGHSSRQTIEDPVPATVNKSRAKKFDGMSMSLAGAITDPRSARVQRILESRVMDLTTEKFSQFNMPSSSKYDFYQNMLRAPNATIKQTISPLEVEKRDMECNTDEIETAEKGVQFIFGDDSTFLTAMEKLQKKRDHEKNRRSESKRSGVQTDTDDLPPATNNAISTQTVAEDNQFSTSGSKLSTFLRRSTDIMVALLKESSGEAKADGSSSSRQAQDAVWVNLGGKSAITAGRTAVMVRFSELQPSVVMSAHPYDLEGKDLDESLSYKGVYCIWDVRSPATPTFSLSASGQPTCCAFSSTQSYLVIAGTEEGSIHLWDLRENAAAHNDRSNRGLRSPSYSSLLDLSILSKLQNSDSEDSQHMCAILQIESLDSGSHSGPSEAPQQQSTVSQFVSIDESGLVCFWVTSVVDGLSTTGGGSANHSTKYGLSPWGRVALLQTRHIQLTHAHSSLAGIPLSYSDKNLPARGNGSRGDERRLSSSLLLSSTQHQYVLSIIPADNSTLLVSCIDGDVSKVARFGEPSHPTALTRQKMATMNLAIAESKDDNGFSGGGSANANGGGALETEYSTEVTCISVRQQNNNTAHDTATSPLSLAAKDSLSGLVLVGRSDGTVDLFQLNCESPLLTWNLGNLKAAANGDSGGGGRGSSALPACSPVVTLKWYTHKDSVFFAVDASGHMFIFDLALSVTEPIAVEPLLDFTSGGGGSDELVTHSVAISYTDPAHTSGATGRNGNSGGGVVSGNGSIFITLFVGKTLKTRKMSDAVLYASTHRSSGVVSSSNREADLRAALTGWSSQSYSTPLVSFAAGAGVGGR